VAHTNVFHRRSLRRPGAAGADLPPERHVAAARIPESPRIIGGHPDGGLLRHIDSATPLRSHATAATRDARRHRTLPTRCACVVQDTSTVDHHVCMPTADEVATLALHCAQEASARLVELIGSSAPWADGRAAPELALISLTRSTEATDSQSEAFEGHAALDLLMAAREVLAPASGHTDKTESAHVSTVVGELRRGRAKEPSPREEHPPTGGTGREARSC
jgi:hypothetical protein